MFNLICTDEKARNELIFIHAIIKNNNINFFLIKDLILRRLASRYKLLIHKNRAMILQLIIMCYLNQHKTYS